MKLVNIILIILIAFCYPVFFNNRVTVYFPCNSSIAKHSVSSAITNFIRFVSAWYMFRSYWPSWGITYCGRTFWCITSVNQVKRFLALSCRRCEAIRHNFHCKCPSKKHLVKGRKSLLLRSLSRKLCKQQTKGNKLISFTNFNAHFPYSLTICMLHYNPRHVSSINMPIFRRTICPPEDGHVDARNMSRIVM
jgi:hypothetical protein